MRYKFFEHTADVIFEGYGEIMEEAFSNAALAMQDVITDVSKVKAVEERNITAEGEDMKSLLYDFLEKFLIIFDSEQIVFSEVEVKEIKESEGKFHLKAVARGEKFDVDRHESKTHVKAVTYHDMDIGEKDGKKFVRVLVDI